MSAITLEAVAAEVIVALAYELQQFIPVAEPQTTPTTVPGVTPPPIPTPTVVPAADKLAAAIYAYNTSRSYFQAAAAYTVPVKDVIIHKITMAQANALSAAVQVACKKYGLDLSFALACIAEESVFDPNCQNGNAGPGESNYSPSNPQGASPLGYDMGVAQLKLRYLLGYDKIETAQAADNFALNVNSAVDYFASIMAGKITVAKMMIARAQSDASAIDPRLLASPELCATGMYNFGDEGFQETYFEKGQFPSHCQQVEDLTNYFAKALGVASIFATLSQ